jgi:hypothetical protein
VELAQKGPDGECVDITWRQLVEWLLAYLRRVLKNVVTSFS